MALTRPTLAQLTTGIARISDPITVLHQGATSANVDVGFLFNRANGLVSNVALYWSESAQSIVTAYTSSTGQIDSNVTVTSYAPLTVGNLLLVNGSIIGVVGNITLGNLIANTGVYATSFNFANGQPFTTSTYSNANVTAYLPTDSTITAIQANVTAANAAIVTANTAMKGYVDAVTTAWTSNAATQQTQINTLQTQVYSNTNVAAYLPTYSGSIGTAVSTSGNLTVNGNIIAGNIYSPTVKINSTLGNYNVLNITGAALAPYGGSQTWQFFTQNIASGGPGSWILFPDSSTQTTAYPGTLSGAVSSLTISTLSTTGNATIGNNLFANGGTASTSTATGALVVSGGAGISGNLWVGGNLYVANIFSVTTNTLSVNDPLVYFQSPSPNPYNYDIGFYSDFVGGPVNIYGHTGVVRAQSSNTWVFFSNINSEPTSTGVNWSDAGVIYDAVKVGAITVANTTTSTSNVTGALVVSGGAGIRGNVFAGNVYTGGLYWAGNGNVISTGGGITYTASTTSPSSPKVGDQWYNTTNDVLYEYQNVGTANFWIDIVSPILSSGTVTTPSGGDLSPFLLMGA